jgi:aspartyl-tRNA(Asn)/glutamyl-tRNA(Gln) amidotransferase subunit C
MSDDNNEKLTIDELRNIAQLARVSFSEEELELVSGQLSDILDHIAVLSEADTDNIEETRYITGASNIYRRDITNSSLSRDQVLKNAPVSQEGYVRVRGVFEEEL